MKNPVILALGVAGLASAAIDIVVDDRTQLSVTCDTTENSQYLHHIREAAYNVHPSPKDKCWHSELNPPYCTKIEQTGARLSICTDKEHRGDGEIACWLVRDAGRAVADNCSNREIGAERAGGYVEEWKLAVNGWEKTPAWVLVSTAT